MREVISTLLGFAAAALPIAVTFAITSPGMGGGFGGDPITTLGLVVLFYFFSLFFTLLFGGPIFIVLRALKLVRWWTSALAGALVGLTVAVIINSRMEEGYALYLFVCCAVGSASAILFWAIWRKGVVVPATVAPGYVFVREPPNKRP